MQKTTIRTLQFSVLYPVGTHCTGRMGWMAHRKWKETKEQTGTAGPGNMHMHSSLLKIFVWRLLGVSNPIFNSFFITKLWKVTFFTFEKGAPNGMHILNFFPAFHTFQIHMVSTWIFIFSDCFTDSFLKRHFRRLKFTYRLISCF